MVKPLEKGFERLPLQDGELFYQPNYLTIEEADTLLLSLTDGLQWRQDKIQMFGRPITIPRLQAWYGDSDAHYRYSGLDLTPTPWTPELLQLRRRIEQSCEHSFNAVLANLYRNGQDSVGWHSDNEPELGTTPVLASLSLGAERRFSLRHKKCKNEKIELRLGHGSLLIMAGETQKNWLHALPKQRNLQTARINLSFRAIVTKIVAKKAR